MKISAYTDKNNADVVKLMALLQDYEKEISQDRAAGIDVAAEHIMSFKLNRMKLSFLSNNHAAEAAYKKFGFSAYETTYKKDI